MNTVGGNRPLKEYMAISWIISGGLAVLTCAIAFFVMGWLDYRNVQDRLMDELAEKSITVSRRLSGELLLGDSGASANVAANLKTELGLSKVELKNGLPCSAESSAIESSFAESSFGEYCSQRIDGELAVLRAIPHVQQNTYVVVTKPVPSFLTTQRFSLFFWSVVPIALVLAFALALQKYFIGKYLLKPIASLVDTSTGAQLPQEYWPKEIKDISQKLSSSFEAREQAVYGQIARGVIHDIRTLLHSVLSATSLVKEQQNDPIKRQDRLETLLRASETNLPKIGELIDLTLDGSREISVSPKLCNLTATVKSAIKTNEALGVAKNIAVQMIDFPENLMLAHDSVQLERVFTNLIKNGIESCLENDPIDPHGAVIISANVNRAASKISIAIDDSGRGLPKEPDKVFRLLKSTKVHGSGLGLTVSRKIVQAHGGELIPAHSPILSGARFEVLLPLPDMGESV